MHYKWRKLNLKMFNRLKNLKGTPRSVAAGLACGVAISFTPFVGIHFILAAITAWLVRGNILASALGTAAGNPWTFPFIWVSVLYTGRFMLGGENIPSAQIDFLHFFEKGMRALMAFDFGLFFHDIWPILLPMMIGCIPYYILAWLLTYYLMKKVLDKLSNRELTKIEREAGKL